MSTPDTSPSMHVICARHCLRVHLEQLKRATDLPAGAEQNDAALIAFDYQSRTIRHLRELEDAGHLKEFQEFLMAEENGRAF